jgi:hypothetical protein
MKLEGKVRKVSLDWKSWRQEVEVGSERERELQCECDRRERKKP